MTYRRIRDTLLYLLIFGCILAIVISQIYLLFSRESETEDAVEFTARSSISFTGVIVRNESLVYSQNASDGIINYLVEDGSRLSKQSDIATIYKSYDQIYYRYMIERLENELDVLESAQNRGTTEYVQPEFISSQISERYKSVLSEIVSGNLTSLDEDRLELLKLMCIYNVSSNVEDNYSERITELNAELDRYQRALVNPIANISATDSGYFTSVVDGYESDISIDEINSITADKIREIISSPIKENVISSDVIGKVFSDYTWKLIGIINTDDRFFVNQSFDLMFSSLEKTYKGYVESITPTGNGNEAIIILSSADIDVDIAGSRVLDAEILFGEYTGIKAPRSAVRFVNDQRGVYILEGEKMVFKKLDVIYEGNDFVLSRQGLDSDYLELYDRVLLDPVPTVEYDASDAPEVTDATSEETSLPEATETASE